ncbi:hypothetical protein EI94DRAFT_1744092 [Lactarius quietus]|nr:hypothetical protein EI94DRAFT_1744092 [Lactarius quietus]
MPKLASKPAPATGTLSPAPTNDSSWLTGPALKAATEHLFATQRAKKASDRAKGKARPSSPAVRGNTTTTTKVVWAEVWEAATTDDGDWPELPILTPALRTTQDRCEVPLAAFVRPVKLRGARAKEVERTEFEFLPPVKNVIALDDAESNVPEEPWEYVSSVGGDDEARKIFSYAEIVSKSA